MFRPPARSVLRPLPTFFATRMPYVSPLYRSCIGWMCSIVSYTISELAELCHFPLYFILQFPQTLPPLPSAPSPHSDDKPQQMNTIPQCSNMHRMGHSRSARPRGCVVRR